MPQLHRTRRLKPIAQIKTLRRLRAGQMQLGMPCSACCRLCLAQQGFANALSDNAREQAFDTGKAVESDSANNQSRIRYRLMAYLLDQD